MAFMARAVLEPPLRELYLPLSAFKGEGMLTA